MSLRGRSEKERPAQGVVQQRRLASCIDSTCFGGLGCYAEHQATNATLSTSGRLPHGH